VVLSNVIKMTIEGGQSERREGGDYANFAYLNRTISIEREIINTQGQMEKRQREFKRFARHSLKTTREG